MGGKAMKMLYYLYLTGLETNMHIINKRPFLYMIMIYHINDNRSVRYMTEMFNEMENPV